MTTTQGTVPMETRYQRAANAAVNAATSALRAQFQFAGSTEQATIEAVGRLASALILADREQP